MSDKFAATVNWANGQDEPSPPAGINWFWTIVIFSIIAFICLYVWLNFAPKSASSRQTEKDHPSTSANTFNDMKRTTI